MAKLTLHLDDLRVESFGTSAPPAAERGTVHGQGALRAFPPTKLSCFSCDTDPCICDPIRVLTEEEGC
jgi:hypothetical protein